MAQQFISRSTDLYKYMQFDKNWLTEIWVNTVADSFNKIRQLLISLSDSACKKGLFHINFLHIFFFIYLLHQVCQEISTLLDVVKIFFGYLKV